MIGAKLFMTVGVGGSRIDYVSGWLGTLPNFIDSQWRIDLETGRSFTLANCIRAIDSYPAEPSTLTSLLSDRDIQLDPVSLVNFSVSCHGISLEKKITLEDLNSMTIMILNTDNVDYRLLNWEFTVKTFMCRHRLEHSFHTGEFYNIDSYLTRQGLDISDHNRCLLIEKFLNQAQFCPTPALEKLPGVVIDYNQLFVPGGSRYLTSKLNIECDPVYHSLWDTNLQYATSPLEIYKFGRIWKFMQ
jgi:hypothetical protein